MAKKGSFSEFFEPINNILYKQGKPYDPKVMNAYLLSLWLSHDSSLLEIVNDINDYHFLLNDDIIYKYYYYTVPKGKRYLRWVKKESGEEKEKDLCKEWGISKMEFRRYKQLIKEKSK